MRRLGLAFLLAAAALLFAVGVLRVESWRGTELEAPVESPKLFYVLDEGRPLVLDVPPETTRVKLVCVLQLPLETPDDPRAEFDFGFDAALVDSRGDEAWAAPVWLSARRTVEQGPEPGATPRERTWLVARDALLSDERALEIDVGALQGRGGTLQLEAFDSAAHPVLVRPYRRHPLEAQKATYRVRAMEERRREQMAGRIGASTWYEVDPAEQEQLSSFRWYRMEAEGARVRDYVTRLVVLGEYRQDASSALARWHYLDPGRAVAFNLVGPARADVEAEEIDGGEGSIALVTVSQWGDIATESVPIHTDRIQREVSVPAGEVVTLSVVADGSAPVRVSASSRDVPAGIFAETSASYERETGLFRLGPDIRILRMHRIPEGGGSLRYSLRPSDLDRVRVEARAVAEEDVEIRATLRAADGGTLATGIIQCPSERSRFEISGTLEPGAMPTPAGRPVRVDLWVGGQAVELDLAADRAVDLVLSVPTSEHGLSSEVEDPYRIETEGVRLRYAPLVERAWSPALPVGLEQLAREGREVCVSAQVRLVPTDAALVDDLAVNPLGWSPPTSTRRRGVTRHPRESLQRQQLMQRWSAGSGVAAWWPANAYTQLQPGTAQRTRIDRSGRARVQVWVDDPELIGTTATLFADGRALAHVPLRSDRPDRTVSLGEGDHELLLQAEGKGLFALVDQPPAPGSAPRSMVRSRTVHQLRSDEPIHVDLPVSAGADAVLYALTYYELEPGVDWPASAAEYSVDLGTERPLCQPFVRTTPPRLGGRLDPMARETGFLADRREHSLVAAAPVRVAIGEDMEGRSVEVTFQRQGGSGTMWARFVAYGVAAEDVEAGDEWIEVDGGAVGVWAWADPFESAGSIAAVVEPRMQDPRGAFVAADQAARPMARELGWGLGRAALNDVVEALPRLAVDARALGFDLVPFRVGDERFVLLAGPDEGRGLLVLRIGGAGVVLQAPHAFHDRRTGAIARALMEETGALALQINTRHRHAVEAAEGESPPADLAARDDTWFQALMLGVLDAAEGALVVQVHGFGRETVPDTDVDLIVSGGWRPHASVVDAFAEGAAAIGGVARYPADTDALGAQGNAQGRIVNARPDAAFLHVEIAPQLRDDLAGDGATRSSLARAIEEALADAEVRP